MSPEKESRPLGNFHISIPKEDRWVLLASLVLQLILGLFFGHIYDTRINLATGYLVATGQNPYIPQDLTAIFNNPAFQGMTSIGYPPPWPLLLGVIYLCSYAIFHNLLVYNLAIKLPIIAANLGLAYLVRSMLREQGVEPGTSRKAWIFMLFNPFILYFTTAWGQFDSIVALLTLMALVLLYQQKTIASAILLALAIASKPISIPILLVVVIYLWHKPYQKLIGFLLIFSSVVLSLTVLPFLIFRWDPSPILLHWNAVFTVSGGMSLTTYYELMKNTYTLPGRWWLIGLVWVPAILLAAWLTRSGVHSFIDLLKKSLALNLIFFLARTWLSEPNLMLVLPLVLLLVSLGELPKFALTATWVLPLIFTIFNTSPPQLLFPILPDLMVKLLQWMDSYRAARLEVRTILVIPWLITGVWIVVRCMRKPSPSIA